MAGHEGSRSNLLCGGQEGQEGLGGADIMTFTFSIDLLLIYFLLCYSVHDLLSKSYYFSTYWNRRRKELYRVCFVVTTRRPFFIPRLTLWEIKLVFAITKKGNVCFSIDFVTAFIYSNRQSTWDLSEGMHVLFKQCHFFHFFKKIFL